MGTKTIFWAVALAVVSIRPSFATALPENLDRFQTEFAALRDRFIQEGLDRSTRPDVIEMGYGRRALEPQPLPSEFEALAPALARYVRRNAGDLPTMMNGANWLSLQFDSGLPTLLAYEFLDRAVDEGDERSYRDGFWSMLVYLKAVLHAKTYGGFHGFDLQTVTRFNRAVPKTKLIWRHAKRVVSLGMVEEHFEALRRFHFSGQSLTRQDLWSLYFSHGTLLDRGSRSEKVAFVYYIQQVASTQTCRSGLTNPCPEFKRMLHDLNRLIESEFALLDEEIRRYGHGRLERKRLETMQFLIESLEGYIENGARNPYFYVRKKL